jgi:hypothetical protein
LHPDLREKLAVAILAPVVLLRLVLEDDDLLGLALLEYLGYDLGSLDIGSADERLGIVTYSQDTVKCNLIALGRLKLFHPQDTARLHLMLLAPCFQNREQTFSPFRQSWVAF